MHLRSTFLLAVSLLLTATSSVGAVELTTCEGPLAPSLSGSCADVDNVGCCDTQGRILWCQGGDLYCIDCAGTFPSCGWNSGGYYDCGQGAGTSDPSGQHPPTCAGGCPPTCAGKDSCSPDCPGDCGTCSGGAHCLDSGICHVPACGAKECGVDPLGFSCGVCPSGTECVVGLFQCLPLPVACTPQDGPGCDGCGCEACVCALHPFCCGVKWDIFCVAACALECAYDCSPCPAAPDCSAVECGEFCGMDCGTCSGGATCYQGQCCDPTCAGKECGGDGCGGSCGDCPGTDVCQAGACVDCQPLCAGKDCGADGCGGTCGVCAKDEICAAGQCVTPDSCVGACGGQADAGCFCDPACQEYGDCCEDVCDQCPEICAVVECGECPEGEVCDPQGQCCTPDCEGKTCGDDGCGGDCGDCPPEEICEDGACVPGGCNGIPWEGCCAAGALQFCDQGNLVQMSCAGDPDCGWNSGAGYYDCGTEGGGDPDGVLPMDCMDYCVPDCADKECGSDGCDGSCGACADGDACIAAACVPDPCEGIDFFGCCDGQTLRWCQDGAAFEKDCGKMTGACGWSDQGGDYNCGTDGGEDPSGAHSKPCPGSCVPDCDGSGCGDDGCGGTCGTCEDGETCEGGACVPDASPVEPGPDTVAPDTAAPDTGGDPPPTTKSSGGCAVGTRPNPNTVPVVLLMVLVLMLLRRPTRHDPLPPPGEVPEGRRGSLRRRGLLLPALILLTACSNGAGPDPSLDLIAPEDTVAHLDTHQDVGPEADGSTGDALQDVGLDGPPPDTLPPDTSPDTPSTDVEPDVPPPPPFDCDSITDGPFVLTKIEGAIASEDLAFDGVGHLIGSNNQAIYKSTADGQVSLLAPDVEFRSGMRYLPNGLLAVNDNYQGRVLLVDPDGVVSVLVSGLSYPNGMTVDKQGYIYVTEHDAGRVLRIHSYTGEYTVLTEEINNPNGITFNNAYDTLYIGSFGAAAIYAMSISPDGVPGRVAVWADFSDTPGLLDGMGVDICGNVYVCEYGATDIWRVSPDGKTKKKIIIGGPLGTYLPNFQWGRGPGWDPLSLYIPDGWKIGVWRAQIG
ncbi:MAG: SMP-30/gluconolactonase/LRE family protein, partial [Pseudomonadota bacterium]